MNSINNIIRLYLDTDFLPAKSPPSTIPPSTINVKGDKAHYLISVMRCRIGDRLELFNGREDSLIGEITTLTRNAVQIKPIATGASFYAMRDLWLIFAPIKRGRLDFLAQKATELGVSALVPTRTEFCQVARVNTDRMRANAIEAAEQTHRLDIPKIMPFRPLKQVIAEAEKDRILIFCDEGLVTKAATTSMQSMQSILAPAKKFTKTAILIGPEGGFSATERDLILSLDHVISLSLGPRLLRSDTAALSALTLFQALCGDWSMR